MRFNVLSLITGALLLVLTPHCLSQTTMVPWLTRFLFNKFDPPVIDGGHIYVPNYNGGVDVYRLVE
jgi:hypothetical protein